VIARVESPRTDVRDTFAIAIGAAGLFLLAWSALHISFYRNIQIIDTPVYETYGEAMVEGDIPYRDFEVEYPPLALPVFLAPAIGEGDYRQRFEWLMALCGCAALLFVALSLPKLRLGIATLAFIALAPLAIGTVMLSRFDLWPAALVAAALAALLADRVRLGHLALGLGIAAKLYPGVLLPLAVAYAWRRRGRREALIGAAIAIGVVVLAYAPFMAIAPEETVRSIGRQLSRPLQIESLGSALLLAVRNTFGLDAEMYSSHGSQNLRATGAVALAVVLSLVQVATLVWLWVRFARDRATPARLARYAAATLVAFVALGKVLSPQFLIWLIPIVPLARRVSATLLLAVALVLTQIWFPFRYWELAHDLDETMAWVVLARDLVLVALLVALVREPADARADERGEAA
jgi:uncharacterized membrane protein